MSHTNWIDQDVKSIFDISAGSTVLIKFMKSFNGITIDSGETVDISWMRNEGKIFATTGDYNSDDIKSWKHI